MNPESEKLNEGPRTITPVVLAAEDAALSEPSLQEWADKVTDASGEAVEKILAIGRVFLAAKKAIKHGGWEKMFRGHPQAVDRPVPYSVAKAKMLMAIASHPVLSNRNYCNDLPLSWRALYELTFLADAEILRLLATRSITPETTGAKVQALRLFLDPPQPRSTPRRHVLPQLLEDYAAHFEMLKIAKEYTLKFWGTLAEEMREPLRIEDGRILSGVLYLPPLLPDPAKVSRPTPEPKHRCGECGRLYKDPRPETRNSLHEPVPGQEIIMYDSLDA